MTNQVVTSICAICNYVVPSHRLTNYSGICIYVISFMKYFNQHHWIEFFNADADTDALHYDGR
jgi:hypothetical protein